MAVPAWKAAMGAASATQPGPSAAARPPPATILPVTPARQLCSNPIGLKAQVKKLCTIPRLLTFPEKRLLWLHAPTLPAQQSGCLCRSIN